MLRFDVFALFVVHALRGSKLSGGECVQSVFLAVYIMDWIWLILKGYTIYFDSLFNNVIYFLKANFSFIFWGECFEGFLFDQYRYIICKWDGEGVMGVDLKSFINLCGTLVFIRCALKGVSPNISYWFFFGLR